MEDIDETNYVEYQVLPLVLSGWASTRPLSLTCQRGQTMPSGKWHPAGFAESTTKTLLLTVRRARFSARRALLRMRPRFSARKSKRASAT